MREFDADIRLVARADGSALITGESGVGKEHIARLAHGWSRRGHAPFASVRCEGHSDVALERELFGDEEDNVSEPPGVLTGQLAQAQGGCLLIKEVGQVSRPVQQRIFRFLESGHLERPGHRPRVADVRIIATTTQPLFERVVARKFLEDLYYRLNVIYVQIAPLRERREDIPSLAAQILSELAEHHRISVPRLAPAAMSSLQAFDWPGNVRELRGVMESLAVSRHAVIEPDDLPPEIVRQTRQGTAPAADGIDAICTPRDTAQA